MGLRIIATAAFDMNAEVINVKKYKIEITAIACFSKVKSRLVLTFNIILLI